VHTGQPCWTIPTDSVTGVKANAATAPIIVTAAPAAMRDRSPRVTKRPRAAHPVRTNRHRSLLTTSDNKSEFGCLDPAARRTAETFQHDAPRCSRETDVVAEGGDIALSPTAKRIPGRSNVVVPSSPISGPTAPSLPTQSADSATPPGRPWYRRGTRRLSRSPSACLNPTRGLRSRSAASLEFCVFRVSAAIGVEPQLESGSRRHERAKCVAAIPGISPTQPILEQLKRP
jgi:hypothetical protein